MIGATFIKEFQLLLRDRGGLLSTFLLPLVFITVFGFAFKGARGPDDEDKGDGAPVRLPLCVFHEEGHEEPRNLVKWLRASGSFQVELLADSEEAARRVANGDFRAGLVFDAAYHPKDHPAILYLDMAAPEMERMAVVGPLRGVFARQQGHRMSPVPVDPDTLPPTPRFFQAESPPGLRRPFANLDSFQVSVPGNAVLFVFFNALMVALSFHEERKSGTWKRLLAAPGARPRLLVGKLLPYLVIGCCQMALLFAAGHFLFGMRVGGSVLALSVITLCVVFTATSMGLLIASFGGTEKQISNYAVILILAMGLLGGCMMPRIFMPETFRAIGQVVPHGWALDAYYDVLIREGTTLGEVLLPCGVIASFGLIFAGLGAALFRFER